jgi:hypothetical protein
MYRTGLSFVQSTAQRYRVTAFVPTEDEKAGLDELVRYIPPGLARRYLDDGWAVAVILGPHAGGKLLASRWVARGGHGGEADPCI